MTVYLNLWGANGKNNDEAAFGFNHLTWYMTITVYDLLWLKNAQLHTCEYA